MENPFKNNPFAHLSKPQKYAVGIGSAGILGYLLIHHHKTSGSWNPFSRPAAGTADNGTDPLTGLPASQDNQVDPETGMTYLAEAQQYGSVQTAEQAVSTFGQSVPSGSGIGVQPASGGAGASTIASGAVASTVYADNQAWAQAATAGLVSISYDPVEVSQALGAYLAGQQLSPSQARIVNTALAEYPIPNRLPVVLAPVKTPGPVTAEAGPRISNGHVISTGTDHASVGWTGTNAVRYQTRIAGPGKINGQVNTVSGTTASFSGLESGHDYEVTVTPFNSAGKSGPSGVISFHTTSATQKKAA